MVRRTSSLCLLLLLLLLTSLALAATATATSVSYVSPSRPRRPSRYLPKRRRFSSYLTPTTAFPAIPCLTYLLQTLNPSLTLSLALPIPLRSSSPLRLLTCSLAHANLPHLLVNTYSMASILPPLAPTLPRADLARLWLCSSLTASMATLGMRRTQAVSLGSSGVGERRERQGGDGVNIF